MKLWWTAMGLNPSFNFSAGSDVGSTRYFDDPVDLFRREGGPAKWIGLFPTNSLVNEPDLDSTSLARGFEADREKAYPLLVFNRAEEHPISPELRALPATSC